MRHGGDSNVVAAYHVHNRVRESGQQMTPRARIVLADRPHERPFHDSSDGYLEFSTEVISEAGHSLVVPTHRGLRLRARGAVEPQPRQVRPAASSRARTVSQSSSSAVPASISSTRRLISSVQAAVASESSGSRLWISSCAMRARSPAASASASSRTRAASAMALFYSGCAARTSPAGGCDRGNAEWLRAAAAPS